MSLLAQQSLNLEAALRRLKQYPTQKTAEESIPEIATQLGLDPKKLKKRWNSFLKKSRAAKRQHRFVKDMRDQSDSLHH